VGRFSLDLETLSVQFLCCSVIKGILVDEGSSARGRDQRMKRAKRRAIIILYIGKYPHTAHTKLRGTRGGECIGPVLCVRPTVASPIVKENNLLHGHTSRHTNSRNSVSAVGLRHYQWSAYQLITLRKYSSSNQYSVTYDATFVLHHTNRVTLINSIRTVYCLLPDRHL
jgi:hypothetical protein